MSGKEVLFMYYWELSMEESQCKGHQEVVGSKILGLKYQKSAKN